MLKLLLVLLVVYVLLGLFVTLFQRQMIYQPGRFSTRLALALGQNERVEPWFNPAGDRIGWRMPAAGGAARASALVLHGNAGWASMRAELGRSLQAAAPVEVFLLEYPGYSERAGSPSERSLYAAAEEALSLLPANRPVFLLGESLGTGVAAYLAGQHPARVNGVLLLAPYDNFASVSQIHMPIFPVRWMLRDRFPSDEHLRQYHGPLAVVLAGRDSVVPNRLGRRLHDGYDGPKKLWLRPDAEHNDLMNQPVEWWREVCAFLRLGSPP